MAEQANTPTDRPARRQLGPPIMEASEIPAGIRDAALSKIGEGGKVAPARADGGYKGKIVYANDRYVVQTVGTEAKSAVVHKREGMEMVGSKLGWRAENGKLANADVQIHYSGDKPKAYVWNREREAAAKLAKAQEKETGGASRSAGSADKGDRKADDARSTPAKAARETQGRSDKPKAPEKTAPARAAGETQARAPRAPRAPARQRAAAQQQAAGGPER